MDNMEESQVTTVEKNTDHVNNCPQEIAFLLFNRQTFLFRLTKTSLTCFNNQHCYRLNAVPHFTVTTLKTALQMTT